MAYVEVSALKETLSLAGESFVDDDLILALNAASEAVDSICGRSFTQAADVLTYAPIRSKMILIDDLIALTGVGVESKSLDITDDDFTAWATTDYELYPLNAGVTDPYTELRLTPRGAQQLTLATRVQITGIFGWPEVPPSVKQATGILAARLIKRAREAPLGVASIGAEGTAMRVARSDPDVNMLLAPFQRALRLA